MQVGFRNSSNVIGGRPAEWSFLWRFAQALRGEVSDADAEVQAPAGILSEIA
jgi:hypothetical protein